MAIFTIPTSTTQAHYRQATALDGEDYVLRFQWNARAGGWFLELADADGVPIVSGVRIVADFPLLRRVTDPRRPPGELIAADLSGQALDPGFAELGERVVLTYLDAEEVGA